MTRNLIDFLSRGSLLDLRAHWYGSLFKVGIAFFLLLASYPSWGGVFALPAAVVGFFLALQQKMARGRWWLLWSAIHFVWLSWMGNSPYLGLGGIFAALFLSALWGFFALIWYLLYRALSKRALLLKPLWGALLLPTIGGFLWGGTELLRYGVFCGYPWAHLAWAFGGFDRLLTLLSWIGIPAASGLIVACAAALEQFFDLPRSQRKSLGLYFVIAIALYLSLSLVVEWTRFGVAKRAGCWRLLNEQQLQKLQEASHEGLEGVERSSQGALTISSRQLFRVAIVGTTWPVSLYSVYSGALDQRWVALVKALAPYRGKVDLVLLPEGVIDGGYRSPQYGLGDSNSSRLKLLAKMMGGKIVAGLTDDRIAGKAENALFCLDEEGNLDHVYGKRILLPLAEEIPFEHQPLIGPYIRSFAAMYGVVGSFTRGSTSSLWEIEKPGSTLLEGLKAHLAICYEETFASTVLAARWEGAQMMISASHDGWYPQSFLPQMHYWQARMVAARVRLPLLRSTQQGISCAIDADGRVVAQKEHRAVGLGEEGALPSVLMVGLYYHPF